MSRRVECPWREGVFIEMPDDWLGEHADRRDKAIRKAREKELGETLSAFTAALAVLENWSIPGLEGNPEKWEIARLPLDLISWVNSEVGSSFLAASNSTAAWLLRSARGLTGQTPTTKANPPGDSEQQAPG